MTRHAQLAKTFLTCRDAAVHHDHTFWHVRENRDHMAQAVPEWEQLRSLASDIKAHTLSHIDTYLEQFEARATSNGVYVHWARDAREYCETVLHLLKEKDVTKVVKSKSMLTEECQLNPFLEAADIEVVETDLGERILQLMKLPPSHIVMPAIHIKKEDVGKCFEKMLGTEKGNADPTYLTYAARQHLRHHFLTAGAGLTGANFAVAQTGDIVVCTNEGNADMSTSIPPLHIVSMGIEKLIPDLESMAVFHRLLARQGTGQPTTTFTSHFHRPRPGCEMHVILVDNGRSQILSRKDHWQTLKCIRCGACMNTCPVYRRSGGYSYSYFIPGPIGINLGMLRDARKHAGNLSACTLCQSCDCVCPVKVDLSQQIYLWRQELDTLGLANRQKKIMSQGMQLVFNHPRVYSGALRFAPVINKLPRRLTGVRINTWAMAHEMPQFATKSFHELWKEGNL
ncbi:MAG: lactate utilization protein [Bacteroidaceae bacterium]|nr:lactate utilization protein [Bacteroidaceae bacterium]